jgi:hypothetical protein
LKKEKKRERKRKEKRTLSHEEIDEVGMRGMGRNRAGKTIPC